MIALLLIAAALLFLWLAWLSKRNSWQQRIPAPAPVRPAPTRQVRQHVPHLLYRYEWLRGGDAYFGISNEPDKRHARREVDPDDQWWFAHTTKVMIPVHWYPDRPSALAAEASTIRREALAGAVLANTHHNPRPIRRGRR